MNRFVFQSGDIESMWNWDPFTLIGGGLLIGLYLFIVGPYRSKKHSSEITSSSQTILFILGIAVIILGKISPLDYLVENHLLTAHMIQHMLYTLLAPPLLLLGTPGWLLSPVLKIPIWKKIGLVLTNPFLAFLLFNITFLFWHLPGIYELSIESEYIHFLSKASFILTALLFWWPLLSPVSELPRLTPPFQILYIFAAAIPCTVLGVMIIFSPTIIYSAHAMTSHQRYFLDPIFDQQIAGVLMVGAENIIYLILLTIVFFGWLCREESKETTK